MSFLEEVKKFNIELDNVKLEQFKTYFEFLVSYNEFVNLTAITKEDEVYTKHFLDSLTLSGFLPKGKITLCDVGSGAGFPSIPNAICNNDIEVTIIDALNKRIVFLNELIKKLGLDNVKALHARAEEFAQTKRGTFDVVTGRAVARLNILTELCLPLVKIGGKFIAMKGISGDEELEEAKKAISLLGGKVIGVNKLSLPDNNGEREIIIIEKVKESPNKYPRSFNLIKNKPL